MAFEPPPAAFPLPTTDTVGPHVAASCFEFLLIELVPLAYRIAADVAARDDEWAGGSSLSSKRNTTAVVTSSSSGPQASAGTALVAAVGPGDGSMAGLGIGGIGGSVVGLDEDETREAVFWRLDGLGYRVGLGIVEKFARDKPRFTDTLDVIKFLCKDLWILVFRKQIDNLKTNHRGVYVLTDSSFKPLSKMSLERGREGMMAQAQPFLFFPAGLIRGALASMGIVATVQAETSELPGATFQIRTLGAKA